MTRARTPAAALTCLALAGCIVLPVTVEGYDSQCQVVTHHMELQAVQIGAIQHCGNQACAGLVLVAGGLAAGSALISGSIVLIGNVAYWAERRAGCLAAPVPMPTPLSVAAPAAAVAARPAD